MSDCKVCEGWGFVEIGNRQLACPAMCGKPRAKDGAHEVRIGRWTLLSNWEGQVSLYNAQESNGMGLSPRCIKKLEMVIDDFVKREMG